MLYLYDERSALTRTVPLREFFAIQPDHLSIQCALSASGKKVACTDPLSSAILIRELDSDAAVERIDVGAQTGLSMNYSALAFADGDRFLIFTGVKTEAEAFKSEKAYGIVELESGRVVRVAERDYLEDARIGTAADRALLNESRADEADFGTGGERGRGDRRPAGAGRLENFADDAGAYRVTAFTYGKAKAFGQSACPPRGCCSRRRCHSCLFSRSETYSRRRKTDRDTTSTLWRKCPPQPWRPRP